MIAAMGFSAACGDSAPVSEISVQAGQASLALRPAFATLPAGAPTVTLSRITVVLTTPRGDTYNGEARFTNGAAELSLNVPIFGVTMVVELAYTAFDTQGVIAFTGRQTLTLRAGRNLTFPSPTLVYDAPDAKVTALQITGTIALAAGGGSTLSVTGILPGGGSLTPRVAWTSSNPAVVSVDENGRLTAGRSQGTATITATSATGITASVQVKVSAPVDRVVVTPGTTQLVRGANVAAKAELRDATNAVIDDRATTWTSSDASIATVSSTGVITAVKIGSATITATSEGKTGTSAVTVVSPVERIELTPSTLTFTSLRATTSVSARLIPVAGASVAGLTPTFASSNPSIASVDANGLVTALANGSARITASIDGITAGAELGVKQVTATVDVQPRSASVGALGEARTFVATLFDAGSSALTQPEVVWTSSNPAVATVVGNGASGTVTGRSPGSAMITATSNGKTDAVLFVVAPQGNLLILLSTASTIQAGQTARFTPKLADANGNAIADVPAILTTTTPNVISISGNVVTGLSAGIGRVVATYGALTTSLNITVTPGVGGGGEEGELEITPQSSERLPGGTQQFTVTGATGQLVWSVNGITGGNSTFGTITGGGFYTAPAAVPTPATFQVCADQASPTARTCATVTISSIPTSGADVIVFNDINSFDATASGNPNNLQMFRNLVEYTGPGPRVAQRGVLRTCGHAARVCATEGAFATTLANAGYTMTTNSDPTLPIPIPSNVKLLILSLPTIPYSVAEINAMKQFSAQGGRILFIGEYNSFYGQDGLDTENDFFVKMGAVMRNIGNQVDCGFQTVPLSNLRPHQVTAGLTNLTMACASIVTLGPNDYPLYVSLNGQYVLAAVAKVDVTPLPGGGGPAPSLNRRPNRDVVPLSTDPTGRDLVKPPPR